MALPNATQLNSPCAAHIHESSCVHGMVYVYVNTALAIPNKTLGVTSCRGDYKLSLLLVACVHVFAQQSVNVQLQ